MRVNIYAEEIMDRIEIVETIASNTGARFIGLRFYLKTHEDMLPPKHPDDDSSGVTFWVKSTRYGFKPGDEVQLVNLLYEAANALNKKAVKTKDYVTT